MKKEKSFDKIIENEKKIISITKRRTLSSSLLTLLKFKG